MALKRRIEAEAGNFAAFARGMSYLAEPASAASHGDGRDAVPDIFSPAFTADPYPSYRVDARPPSALFPRPVAGLDPEPLRRCPRGADEPVFTTRSYAAQTEPLLGRTIIQLDGREHNVQRNLLIKPFRAASIEQRWNR